MGALFVNIEEKVWLLVKKIRTWKDWQGDWNFAFWQKLGDFIETKVKKSPTSPGLVTPVTCRIYSIRVISPYDILVSIFGGYYHFQQFLADQGLGLWCLTPLSTIFQLYRGSQFYCRMKPGVPGEIYRLAASHWQRYHIMLYQVHPSHEQDLNSQL